MSHIVHNLHLKNFPLNKKETPESYIRPHESVLMYDHLNIDNISFQARFQNCIDNGNTSTHIKAILDYEETCLPVKAHVSTDSFTRKVILTKSDKTKI